MRTGRADAFVGIYLRGDGTGRFSAQDGTESGFFVEGDGTARVATGNGASLVVATQNSGPLKAFRPRQPDSMRTVRLQPLDRSATLVFENGDERRAEFYYGSGYLSQSSRVLRIPPDVEEVAITNSKGERPRVPLGEDSLANAKK